MYTLALLSGWVVMVERTADHISTTQNAEEAAELKKKRTFRKFSYRGIDLDQYVFLPPKQQSDTPRALSTIQSTSNQLQPLHKNPALQAHH